ncbi:hypothetical protein [Alsobacter sp. SYSU BS001988]|jgi:hypothetical protein
MATVLAIHSVRNMDQWLKGKDRERLFPTFCSSYRLFKHADGTRVGIVMEGVDLAKMQETIEGPEGQAAKAADTVIDPIEVYVEIEGGT